VSLSSLYLTVIVMFGIIFPLQSCSGLNPEKDKSESSSGAPNEDSNGDGEEDGDEKDDTVGPGSLAIGVNPLAASYPEGFTASAFPKQVDTEPGVAAPGAIVLGLGNHSLKDSEEDLLLEGALSRHPREKQKEDKARLEGTAESCFASGLSQAFSSGPSINDKTEVCFNFDYGIISGTTLGVMGSNLINAVRTRGDDTPGSVASAIQAAATFVPDTSGEVCMVSKGRELVSAAIGQVEAALQFFQGMICQAKKDGLADTMPNEGETLDLSSIFSSFSAGGDAQVSISKGSITQQAAKNGRKVYQSTIAYNFGFGSNSAAVTISLNHSPGLEGNTNYDGILTIEEVPSSGPNQGRTTYTSVKYKRSGSSAADQNLKYEIRRADVHVNNISGDALNKDGTVNFNVGAGADGSYGPKEPNEYVENMDYFAFDINPSTYAGKISFWKNPGGNYTEPSRGFNFITTQESDGTLKGCSYSGAVRGVSIRKTLKDGGDLVPDGCYTPELNNGDCGEAGNNQGVQVWKQCFAQDSSGKYLPDESKMTADGKTGYDLLPSAPGDIPKVDPASIIGIGDYR